MTLEQAITYFMMSREEYCTEKSVRDYTVKLSVFVKFMENEQKQMAAEIGIETIGREELQKYTLYLRTKEKRHGGGKLTNRTIRDYQQAVKIFLNYLYEEELMKNKVAARYKIIREEKRQKVPLTNAEVKRIEETINVKTKIGARNMCAIHLMLDAGLRRSEVVNLKIADVDFAHSYIKICNGKGNKDRIVPMSARLRRYLYKYMVQYRPHGNGNQLLQNMTANAVKMMFDRLKANADVPRVTPHLMRHTFATAFVLQGGDLETLRLLMGHTDISTTQKYLHLAGQLHFLRNDVYTLDMQFTRCLVGD